MVSCNCAYNLIFYSYHCSLNGFQIEIEELLDEKIKKPHLDGGISHIHYGNYVSQDVKDILVHRYRDADWVLTFIRPRGSKVCYILIR